MENKAVTSVSVILPSYNSKDYIEECIKSIVEQSLNNIEIICVDAGSADGTIEILEQYKKNDDRIKVINANRKSYGYQVNTGISFAKGEYIAIVESDDFIEKTMYEELYDYSRKTGADVVKMPYIEYYNRRRQEVCYYADKLNRLLPLSALFSIKEHGELLSYHASVWAGIYKRTYLMEKRIRFVEAPGAGYVDVGFRQDSLLNTEKIAWYPKALYYYRVSNQASSTNNFDLPTMILRWNETHQKLNDYQDKDYLNSYLIFDEYFNTLAYIGRIKLSAADYQKLIANFSFTGNKIIETSPVLNDYLKNEILEFKHHPEEFYKKRNSLFYIRKLLYLLAGCIMPKGTKRRKFIKKVLLIGHDA